MSDRGDGLARDAAGRTQLERRNAGLPYLGDASAADRGARARRLAARFERDFDDEPRRAREALADLLGTLAESAVVLPPLRVDDGENLHIGERTFVNVGLTALDVVPIRIGAECQLGPNVQLLAPVHPIDPELRAAYVEGGQSITIEDGVWLGGGVIVCPGVTIGAGSVIGAGAVVTRDVPPRSVAVGNPARVLRSVDEASPKETARWVDASDALALAGQEVPRPGERRFGA